MKRDARNLHLSVFAPTASDAKWINQMLQMRKNLQKASNECGSWWEMGLMCRSNCRSWQFRVPASWRKQLEGDLWHLRRQALLLFPWIAKAYGRRDSIILILFGTFGAGHYRNLVELNKRPIKPSLMPPYLSHNLPHSPFRLLLQRRDLHTL